jgi:hypothetical protein
VYDNLWSDLDTQFYYKDTVGDITAEVIKAHVGSVSGYDTIRVTADVGKYTPSTTTFHCRSKGRVWKDDLDNTVLKDCTSDPSVCRRQCVGDIFKDHGFTAPSTDLGVVHKTCSDVSDCHRANVACDGTDDGTGTACVLNADRSACAVDGGDCNYTPNTLVDGAKCELGHDRICMEDQPAAIPVMSIGRCDDLIKLSNYDMWTPGNLAVLGSENCFSTGAGYSGENSFGFGRTYKQLFAMDSAAVYPTTIIGTEGSLYGDQAKWHSDYPSGKIALDATIRQLTFLDEGFSGDKTCTGVASLIDGDDHDNVASFEDKFSFYVSAAIFRAVAVRQSHAADLAKGMIMPTQCHEKKFERVYRHNLRALLGFDTQREVEYQLDSAQLVTDGCTPDSGEHKMRVQITMFSEITTDAQSKYTRVLGNPEIHLQSDVPEHPTPGNQARALNFETVSISESIGGSTLLSVIVLETRCEVPLQSGASTGTTLTYATCASDFFTGPGDDGSNYGIEVALHQCPDKAASCVGADDGTGTACVLNAASSACAVESEGCTFSGSNEGCYRLQMPDGNGLPTTYMSQLDLQLSIDACALVEEELDTYIFQGNEVVARLWPAPFHPDAVLADSIKADYTKRDVQGDRVTTTLFDAEDTSGKSYDRGETVVATIATKHMDPRSTLWIDDVILCLGGDSTSGCRNVGAGSKFHLVKDGQPQPHLITPGGGKDYFNVKSCKYDRTGQQADVIDTNVLTFDQTWSSDPADNHFSPDDSVPTGYNARCRKNDATGSGAAAYSCAAWLIPDTLAGSLDDKLDCATGSGEASNAICTTNFGNTVTGTQEPVECRADSHYDCLWDLDVAASRSCTGEDADGAECAFNAAGDDCVVRTGDCVFITHGLNDGGWDAIAFKTQFMTKDYLGSIYNAQGSAANRQQDWYLDITAEETYCAHENFGIHSTGPPASTRRLRSVQVIPMNTRSGEPAGGGSGGNNAVATFTVVDPLVVVTAAPTAAPTLSPTEEDTGVPPIDVAHGHDGDQIQGLTTNEELGIAGVAIGGVLLLGFTVKFVVAVSNAGGGMAGVKAGFEALGVGGGGGGGKSQVYEKVSQVLGGSLDMPASLMRIVTKKV